MLSVRNRRTKSESAPKGLRLMGGLGVGVVGGGGVVSDS